MKVYLELGQKRVIACAADWPGWCRAAKDEPTALTALFEAAPRYAHVVSAATFNFQLPQTEESFNLIERLEGNATTDFGAPAIIPTVDKGPFTENDLKRYSDLLESSWAAFDSACKEAVGKELRKGPRGGGRDLEKIVFHVLEAELAYLRRLTWKLEKSNEPELSAKIANTHRQILAALGRALEEGLPAHGPRGGVIWTPHYFVRRTAWHVLDHTWEIEDRLT